MRVRACCVLRAKAALLSRPGAAADAFLLKIVIEERLGYPVQLISDGLAEGVESVLNLTGPASVYAALARGAADVYPEVRALWKRKPRLSVRPQLKRCSLVAACPETGRCFSSWMVAAVKASQTSSFECRRCGCLKRGMNTRCMFRPERCRLFCLRGRAFFGELCGFIPSSRARCNQVASFGRLGVLGRTGWYCAETDVDRWNALAGYRGLKDPAVKRYFNSTFLAFEAEGWGPNQALMTNLGLPYEVVFLGASAAPNAIRAGLDAGIPSFFYLWSPHGFNIRYGLSRIQLPAYTHQRFEEGRSDYPTDVLEKVASMTLSEHSPRVAELYSRFEIDNSAQESVLAAMDSGLSTMEATCAWLREEKNVAVWAAWVPAEKFTCDAGHYVVDATSCAPCPAGSASVGGTATACVQCSAGTLSRMPLLADC